MTSARTGVAVEWVGDTCSAACAASAASSKRRRASSACARVASSQIAASRGALERAPSAMRSGLGLADCQLPAGKRDFDVDDGVATDCESVQR